MYGTGSGSRARLHSMLLRFVAPAVRQRDKF